MCGRRSQYALPRDPRAALVRPYAAASVARNATGAPEPRDPDVGAVREPVVVADVRRSRSCPSPCPTSSGSRSRPRRRRRSRTRDRRCRPASVRDHAVRADLVPAVVHVGRGVQHADLGDRAVHRDEVLVVHAVVGAERPAQRVVARARCVNVRAAAASCFQQRCAADAVLVPALHRAARARALVALTGPLVVAPRHVVQHARADARAVGLDACASRSR